jgi:LCP family protein required for cell wall assembly
VARGALIGTKILAALLSVTVLVGSYWVWNTWTDFKASISHGAPINPAGPSGSTGPKDIDGPDQNILLLGNDSREGATADELAALGTEDDGGGTNTDTMMILHVPGNGKNATEISFPRDSYVSIPGHGMAKLNAAYPFGYNPVKNAGGSELDAQSAGINLLGQTLQQLTGLRIDHYVQINLLGFYRISNEIGGVPVVLCQPQKEANSGIDLQAGLSKIQGKQAMAFVRQRYDVPGFDLGRIKRQQYFLKSAFHQLLSNGTLTNLFRIQGLLKAISSSLVTDPSIDLAKLAGTFAGIAEGSVDYQTIPTKPHELKPVAGGGSQDVLPVDPAEVVTFVNTLIGHPAGATTGPALPNVPTVAPGSFTVTVVNASNTDGIAGRNADQLKAAGFNAVVDQAATGTTGTTTIQYPPTMPSQAKTLAAQIPGALLVESPSATGVTLRLGTDGLQVNGLTTGSPTTGTSSAPPSANVPIGTGVPNKPDQPGCID